MLDFAMPMTRSRAKILFGGFWGLVSTALVALVIVARNGPPRWVVSVFCVVYALIFVKAITRARHHWQSLPPL
jgi:hypothetical protein